MRTWEWERWSRGLKWLVAGSLGVIATQLVILGAIRWAWPLEDVAAYGTVRRWASTVQPILMVGVGSILPAWLAREQVSQRELRRLLCAWAGGACGVTALVVYGPTVTREVMLGGAMPVSVAWATAAFIAAVGLQGVALTLLQGQGHLVAYAGAHLLMGGVAPLIMALASVVVGGGLERELWATALVIASVALAIIHRAYHALPVTVASPPRWRAAWRRIPADIGVPLLLTLPAAVTAATWPGTLAGRLAWGGVWLAAAGTLTAAMHLRVTRFAAVLVRHGRVARAHEEAARYAHRATRWGVGAALVLSAGEVVHAWWQPGRSAAELAVLVGQWWVLPGYLRQLVARRFVDGLEERPLVMRPVIWGGGIAALGLLVGWAVGAWWPAVAVVSGVLGYTVMGRAMAQIAIGRALRWWDVPVTPRPAWFRELLRSE